MTSRGPHPSALVAAHVAALAPDGSGVVRTTCPVCSSLSTSLAYRPGPGFWKCFRCHARGRLWARGESLDDATDELDEAPGVDPPEGFVPLAGDRSILLAPAREYLASRGLSPAEVSRRGVGACLSGPMAGRVILPVPGPGPRWAWYVARAWGKARRPYMYPRGSRAGVMFGAAALSVETDEPAVVVEGWFDAVAGGDDYVAVLGKPSDGDVEALTLSRRPVAVMLDGDAWRDGLAVARRLRLRGLRAGAVRLPPGCDPDEVAAEARRAAALAAVGSDDGLAEVA